MRKVTHPQQDKLKIKLGKKIGSLIFASGYKSPYEFWLEHGGDGLSRSNLNYIINGKGDPKISTLKVISDGLNIELSELLKDI